MVCHYSNEINGKIVFIHENTKTHRFDIEIRSNDGAEEMDLSKRQGLAVLKFVAIISGIESEYDGNKCNGKLIDRF